MLKLKYAVVALALFIGIQAHPALAADKTIVEIAVDNKDFSSLVDAVVSQNLADALSAKGPYTVFAPTNAAFTALPDFAGKALKAKPELLKDILLYHVVSGELKAADVLAQERLTTLNDRQLAVNLKAGAPRVNQANITATDIDASNGVIHVIDSVLIPQSVYDEYDRQLNIQIRDLYKQLLELYTYRANALGR